MNAMRDDWSLLREEVNRQREHVETLFGKLEEVNARVGEVAVSVARIEGSLAGALQHKGLTWPVITAVGVALAGAAASLLFALMQKGGVP